QNFDPGWTVSPQFEHFARSGVAQTLQNFAPSRFSVPHFAQRMSPRRLSLGLQFVEQRLGVLQVGGVEALGEPAVDFSKHRARFVAAIGVAEQAREADRGAQFPRLGFLSMRDSDRLTKAIVSLRQAFQTSLPR